MEKKGGTSKLRSLKEFLSSTRSLNHQNHDGMLKKSPHSSTSIRSSIRNTKNSISLFNLIAPSASGSERISSQNGGNLERPLSMALDEQYGYAYEDRDGAPRRLHQNNKSVSMYGLSPEDTSNVDSSTIHQGNSTRNLAARLFYNLRSKFRKRRRDRSKIVDSKSTEFGTLFPEEKSQVTTSICNDVENCDKAAARYQLKSASSLDAIIDNPEFTGAETRIQTREALNESEAVPGTSNTAHRNTLNDLDLSLKMLAEATDSIGPSLADSSRRRLLEPSSPVSLAPSLPSPKPAKSLTKELEDLLHYGWYWGGLGKEEADAKLKNQPDGSFVVRDSSSVHFLLSLSFNSNGETLHTRIEYQNGQFCFYMSPDSDTFSTVAELIENCIANSEAGVFCYSKPRRSGNSSKPYPVRLTKPISRFTEVKSLLYLSRLKIRQCVRFDLIPQLPLPSSLVEFVSEQRYI